MPPITNSVIERSQKLARWRHATATVRFRLTVLVLIAACGSSGGTAPDAGVKCVPPNNTAPTYTELYTKYFAPGTPGHCATPGCHDDPDHTVWLCGKTKDTCYTGMISIGLIDPENPTASRIGNPNTSDLSWVNPNGPMPFDGPGPFPEGRDAILAWVAACAQNN